jgi:hypothetical protein
MITGFSIEQLGFTTGAYALTLQIYMNTNIILTVNFLYTLSSTPQPLFIPLSYASQQANGSAPTDMSFTGTQNPIFEIGSTFTYALMNVSGSSVNVTYTSTGPNSFSPVSQAIGTIIV